MPAALPATAPFSAAFPLSGELGSYMLVMTGFTAGGAAGGGAGAMACAAGGGLGDEKHISYSPSWEAIWSSWIWIKKSTTDRCPPRHISCEYSSLLLGLLCGKRTLSSSISSLVINGNICYPL